MTSPFTHLTIGHSTHDIDHFVGLLRLNRVTAVADVRSVPASRYSPQFNRDPLKRALASASIKYVFLGRELGARSDDPDCYEAGKVQYNRLAKTELFQKGIDRLLRGARKEVIAVTCTERDPLDCHRTLLVATQLVARGARVGHILSDGRIESHDEAMLRLRALHGFAEPDLFHSAAELLAEAMGRQESRIAYVDNAAVAGRELR
jgi:uncharacterized protein (DUF488 family)